MPGRVTDPDEVPDTPSLADLLVDMAEEGRRARGVPEEMPPWASTAPRAGVPIVGCLFRLFLFLVLLALVAVAAVSLLLSGAF